MRLGYHTGYWSAGPPPGAQEAVLGAEQLGFDSVWTAEAYGSDALTPLAWWGARTSRIRLGTAIAQISARTPTAAAMAALTLDHLSGRPVRAGPRRLRPAGGGGLVRPAVPQARSPAPASTCRSSGRCSPARRPVTFDGQFYRLPLPADEGVRPGQGAALDRAPPARRPADPPRRRGPAQHRDVGGDRRRLAAAVLLAAHGRRVPDAARRGVRASAPPGCSAVEDFEVVATVPVVLGADVESAADSVRPFIALYAGGMGAKGANFHRDVLDRLGYAEACDEIQAHYLAGDRARATAAVPLELVQDIALVGTVDDIRAQLPAWEAHRGHDDAGPGRPAHAARRSRRPCARPSDRSADRPRRPARRGRSHVLALPTGVGKR